MPHGQSWFSLLPFHERFLALAHYFGKPLRDVTVAEGLHALTTWIGGKTR